MVEGITPIIIVQTYERGVNLVSLIFHLFILFFGIIISPNILQL